MSMTNTRSEYSAIRRHFVALALLIASAHSVLAQTTTLAVRLDSVVAPGAQFGAIASLVAIDSMHAVILDGRAGDVSLITVGTSVPQLLSHRGDGPGEFRFALRIGRFRDSIWVVAQNRFAVLPLDGRAGVTIDPSVTAAPVEATRHILLLGLLGNGAALGVRQYFTELPDDSAHSQGSVLLGPPGVPQWTEIAVLHAAGPLNVTLQSSSGGRPPVTEGYENSLRIADLVLPQSDGGGFIIVRQRGAAPNAASSMALERYDMRGRLQSSRTVRVAPLPDAEQVINGVREALQQRLQSSRFHRLGGDVSRVLDQQLGAHPPVPVASEGFAAGDGTVWLHRLGTDDNPAHWIRVDLATGALAQATFGLGCAPLDEQQGRLWLTCTENDIPVIRRAWVSAIR